MTCLVHPVKPTLFRTGNVPTKYTYSYTHLIPIKIRMSICSVCWGRGCVGCVGVCVCVCGCVGGCVCVCVYLFLLQAVHHQFSLINCTVLKSTYKKVNFASLKLPGRLGHFPFHRQCFFFLGGGVRLDFPLACDQG